LHLYSHIPFLAYVPSLKAKLQPSPHHYFGSTRHNYNCYNTTINWSSEFWTSPYRESVCMHTPVCWLSLTSGGMGGVDKIIRNTNPTETNKSELNSSALAAAVTLVVAYCLWWKIAPCGDYKKIPRSLEEPA
jgi:hypothetical protein